MQPTEATVAQSYSEEVIRLWYVMLCHVILCYAMLYYVISCHVTS